MQTDYNEKIVRFSPDGAQVEEDKFKHRPGDVVYVATIPNILEVVIVGVSYPEDTDYTWMVKVGETDIIRVHGSILYKSYDEAYNALTSKITEDIARYERRVIVWKSDLMRLAEDKEEREKKLDMAGEGAIIEVCQDSQRNADALSQSNSSDLR